MGVSGVSHGEAKGYFSSLKISEIQYRNEEDDEEKFSIKSRTR